MIDFRNISKTYSGEYLLKDVNCRINTGERVGVVGPNGAGKSTLMKSVIGLLRFEGEITVNGFSPDQSEARRMLGYIPELPALYPNLTVWEHMEFLARAYRLKDYKERSEALLKRFELYEHRKKFGDELSKGMQQKLNICLGLLSDPEVLLLDEPMIGLDPHAIKEVRSMIHEQRDLGKTMLISTHIIDSVSDFFDRALIMQKGVIKADVTREQLEENGQTLEELFFAVTEGIGRDEVTGEEFAK